MTASYDRVLELQRSAIPGRLAIGAGHLGRFWSTGTGCEGGWSGGCQCSKKTEFCEVKARWIDLLLELHGGTWPYGVDPSDPYAVIKAMATSQFDATGLTMLVEIPPARKPIKIGAKGTSWDTILDLAACAAMPETMAEALEAIVKIQSVM